MVTQRTPEEGTEIRSTKLPQDIAKICMEKWLFKEIELLNPKVIISFGEELYQLLKGYVVEPLLAPDKLSETKDKSKIDAELKCAEDGPFKIKLGSNVMDYYPLRHPGSSKSLSASDQRQKAYQKSRARVIDEMRYF
ncbi:hypothetical protein F9K33_09755 [bacterium]|nr:MAG: hypothetical protein F9K33_09755 [bacterium]